ncbi:MAG TPA: DUF3352 domain-containing protein, partial [Isosphaeraceae bacterium]|nr:DUF3352 domain-containing protein [Isosphaeraceae bacterium]
LIGWLGLWVLTGLPAHLAQAATPPERILPDTTVFLFKLNDAKSFREAFRNSQYGQLWNDPSLKDFKDELALKLEDATKSLKERIGVSLKELFELPQGSLAVAAVSRDDPNLPIAGAILADTGENEKRMLDILGKTTKQAEESGAKTSTESFNGLTLHVIRFPQKEQEKEKDEKDKEKEKATPPPPLVWTNAGSLFFITSDVDLIKDLATHREGRDNSLATTEPFAKTQAKTESSRAQVIWYLNVPKLVKVVIDASAKANQAQAQQAEVLVKELGVDGLKSVGGCFTLGTGNYDSLSKTFFLAPKPVAGLLKIFSFPPLALRPESWVPATVATYQTLSFDLDNVYTAINDLVNKFQPGMINIIEQQLAGPAGGQPLNFQNDIFGPLGDRITLISDFKKPVKEDSQRMLLAVALENSKAFQNTLTQLFEIAQAAPVKREFQGTTIYDLAVNLPNQAPGNPQGLKGPISLAVAKDTLFMTTDTTLLEQVLRPGNPTLADSTSYQTVAKEFPEKSSGISYIRPDESARLTYDLIKSGQFEKAIQQATAGRPGAKELPSLKKMIPTEKLPDFSVFVKYLSLGGSFSLMDDDGFTLTGFTLRRSNP